MGELARATGALGVAEAQAFVAVFGFDLGEQDGDLGHRFLPAGEDFGIADRVGQGQEDRGHFDVGNAVVVGGWALLFLYEHGALLGDG
ncbi:hypothetical protein D3C79_939080 [compost metagenome]